MSPKNVSPHSCDCTNNSRPVKCTSPGINSSCQGCLKNITAYNTKLTEKRSKHKTDHSNQTNLKRTTSTEIEVKCMNALTSREGKRELVYTNNKKCKDATTDSKNDQQCVICGGKCIKIEPKPFKREEKNERIPKCLLGSSALSKRHATCGQNPVGPKCDKCANKIRKEPKCLNSLREYRKECICEICGNELVLCIVCGKEVDGDEEEDEEIRKEEYYEILDEMPITKCGYCGRELGEHKKDDCLNKKSENQQVYYTRDRASIPGFTHPCLSYISVEWQCPVNKNVSNSLLNGKLAESKSEFHITSRDRRCDTKGYHCADCNRRPYDYLPYFCDMHSNIAKHRQCDCGK